MVKLKVRPLGIRYKVGKGVRTLTQEKSAKSTHGRCTHGRCMSTRYERDVNEKRARCKSVRARGLVGLVRCKVRPLG